MNNSRKRKLSENKDEPHQKKRKVDHSIVLFYSDSYSGCGHTNMGIKIDTTTKECKIGWEERWMGMKKQLNMHINGTLNYYEDGVYGITTETGEMFQLDTRMHGCYLKESRPGGMLHNENRWFFVQSRGLSMSLSNHWFNTVLIPDYIEEELSHHSSKYIYMKHKEMMAKKTKDHGGIREVPHGFQWQPFFKLDTKEEDYYCNYIDSEREENIPKVRLVKMETTNVIMKLIGEPQPYTKMEIRKEYRKHSTVESDSDSSNLSDSSSNEEL